MLEEGELIGGCPCPLHIFCTHNAHAYTHQTHTSTHCPRLHTHTHLPCSYLVQTVIPMLPRLLCEQLCSLNPGEERFAFSLIWTLDADGRVLDEWAGRSVILSRGKLAYPMVQQMIEGAFDPARWGVALHAGAAWDEVRCARARGWGRLGGVLLWCCFDCALEGAILAACNSATSQNNTTRQPTTPPQHDKTNTPGRRRQPRAPPDRAAPARAPLRQRRAAPRQRAALLHIGCLGAPRRGRAVRAAGGQPPGRGVHAAGQRARCGARQRRLRGPRGAALPPAAERAEDEGARGGGQGAGRRDRRRVRG